ncbi:hypothetical protein CJF31_00007417 [Rutstroemia sp. NJR-2017a BVV2]|nr:hypothetical protein CJF31_00007417 [Rutstroemia sp. NJR-2017a BVV2]
MFDSGSLGFASSTSILLFSNSILIIFVSFWTPLRRYLLLR